MKSDFQDLMRSLDERQTADVDGLLAQQIARYAAMRRDGQSHNMALVLATRTFPGVRTDVEFNRGRCNGNQFENTPGLGDFVAGVAASQGVNPLGKHYCHGLADYLGDPTAWVSDRGDVRRVAEAKGYKVSGLVEYQPPEREPMGDVAIAPDLIAREVDEILTREPWRDRDAVREEVTAIRTGAVDENPLLVED